MGRTGCDPVHARNLAGSSAQPGETLFVGNEKGVVQRFDVGKKKVTPVNELSLDRRLPPPLRTHLPICRQMEFLGKKAVFITARTG